MDNKINSNFRGLTLLKSVINLKWRMGKFPILRADSFNGLVNLKELDLKNNSIKFITENTFIGLSKLNKLVLDENNLEIIKSNTFNGLYALTTLNLENNQIKAVEPYSFIGLSSLPKITLQNNNLESLCSNTFIGLSALSELNLENNQIHFLEPSSFLGLFNLKILLLSKNRLRELNESTFYGLCNLKYLDITQNIIEYVSSNTFYKLPELSHLYLIGNKLNRIDHLNKPQNLVYIDLNQIYTEASQKNSNLNHVDGGHVKKIGQISSVTNIRKKYSINNFDMIRSPFFNQSKSDHDLSNIIKSGDLTPKGKIKNLNAKKSILVE